jgi:N-acetylglucosaminyldiphosphoundecaprenol N-acetyl-beta-D-mannosaminyltransferase
VVTAGAAASTPAALARLVPAWAVLPWLVAALAVPAFVVIGLAAARAPREYWLALLEAPRYLIWKVPAYRRLLRGFDPAAWERSRRASDEAESEVHVPIDLGGVRVDPLTMEGARARLREALQGDSLVQVSTVNLDFLAHAQTQPAVRKALQFSTLNIPDGAPVVWLGRLLGRRVPERVAGADLVPLLLEDAARAGASVFLLGGERGAATEAAARWRTSIPGTRIAGCCEPPRAPLDELDKVNGERLVDLISRSGARVLLVALGHPKQELWIDRYRDQLPVSVAIGVGCVFDLAAGRSRRAPGWMRRAGLEWLYRVGREPRRLARRYATDLWCLAVLSAQVVRRRLVEQVPIGPEQVLTAQPVRNDPNSPHGAAGWGATQDGPHQWRTPR